MLNLVGGSMAMSWERMNGIVRSEYRLLEHGKPSGFGVYHCGHQTAIRGYYIALPNNTIVERKYRTSTEAKAACEAMWREAA